MVAKLSNESMKSYADIEWRWLRLVASGDGDYHHGGD